MGSEVDRELQDLAARHAAMAERGEVHARDYARAITTFRKELVNGGLPVDLADDLTREWAASLIWPSWQADDEDGD